VECDRHSLVTRLHVRGDDTTGVVVVDAMCRLVADALGTDRPPVLRTLRSVRFLAPLLPGDVLTLRLTAAKRDRGWSVRAEGTGPDGTVVARIHADFTSEPLELDPGRSIRALESFGRAAARLGLMSRVPGPGDGRIYLMAGARNVSFEATVRPGDVLRHEIRLHTVVADTAFASGVTWIGDRRLATVGNLVATLYPIRVCTLPPRPDPLGGPIEP